MALQFATSQGFMSGYPSVNLPIPSQDYTFMCWLNDPTSVIWGKGVGAYSMCGLYSGTYNATTTPTSACQIGTRSGTTIDVWNWGGTVMISSVAPYAPPTSGTWYHVAYVYTAANTTHKLYINGVLNNTAVNALQQTVQFTQVYLNGYPQTSPATSETSACAIDQPRCYTRALTANEILTIYQSFGTNDGIVYGLSAMYDFCLNAGVVPGTLQCIAGSNNQINSYSTSGSTITAIAGVVNSLSRLIQ